MHLIDYASMRIVFSIAYFSSDLLLVLRAQRMREMHQTQLSLSIKLILNEKKERKKEKKPLSTNHLLIRKNVKLFI